MATLDDVSFFRRPMGSIFSGQVSELGPVYQTPGGGRFSTYAEGGPTERERAEAYIGQTINPGIYGQQAQMARTPGGIAPNPDRSRASAGDAVGGVGRVANAIAEGAMQGVTAPGRAARGEPVTYGDAWATALDYGVLGAPMAAPDGALRANSFRAYHGSPHDFDEFRMDRIGTGEGAQAYGHGLYFAESEGVARSYRDSLAQTVSVDGNPILSNNRRLSGTTGDDYIDDLLVAYNGDLDAAIASERAFADDLISRGQQSRRTLGTGEPYAIVNALEELRGRVESGNTGRMYEVNINADPDTFLDWDAGFRQLPEQQQRTIERVLRETEPTPTPRQAAQMDDILAELDLPPDYADSYDSLANITGAGAYNSLASNLRRAGPDPQRLAAQELRDAGIPGIRYYDQGSRAAGQGTRNFVVFDESIINVIRKYGVAGAAPMLGLTASELQSEMDAQGL